MKPADLDSVFGDLVQEPRCVAWREERRGDDVTKIPVSPVTARNTSSTDASTLGTLEDALYMRDAKRLDGVGIVLGDSLEGVDLDACRDPETGEIAHWARTVIDEFNTYCEVSPSGTGVKLFAFGAPPDLPPARSLLTRPP